MFRGYSNLTYSWTNSLGVKYYTMGFGKVSLSPVQLFQPTPTAAPTSTPRPSETLPSPTATSWFPDIGCISLTWSQVKSQALTIVNERGDSLLIYRKDGFWWGNNNADNCYTISGVPRTVTNLDDGRTGTWTWTVINLGWIDPYYVGNAWVWRVSNYVWVGMVDEIK
jgi:hypothetical protein